MITPSLRAVALYATIMTERLSHRLMKYNSASREGTTKAGGQFQRGVHRISAGHDERLVDVSWISLHKHFCYVNLLRSINIFFSSFNPFL